MAHSPTALPAKPPRHLTYDLAQGKSQATTTTGCRLILAVRRQKSAPVFDEIRGLGDLIIEPSGSRVVFPRKPIDLIGSTLIRRPVDRLDQRPPHAAPARLTRRKQVLQITPRPGSPRHRMIEVVHDPQQLALILCTVAQD